MDYLNDEKKNHRDTTVRDLEFRLNRFLECFKTKPVPRDSETLFKGFYELLIIHTILGVKNAYYISKLKIHNIIDV